MELKERKELEGSHPKYENWKTSYQHQHNMPWLQLPSPTKLLIPSGIHYLRYTSKNPFSRIRAVLILKTRNDVHSRVGPGLGTFK